MRKKIFIAINIPENIKNKLMTSIESDDFALLPVKWVEKDDLYFIIDFLGYASDEDIYEVTQSLDQLKDDLDFFSLSFNKITVGPSKEDPHVVLLKGTENKALNELNKEILNAINDINLIKKGKKQKFLPHITLGRVEKSDANEFKMEDTELKISFPVTDIELVESFKERNKIKYAVLKSIELGE